MRTRISLEKLRKHIKSYNNAVNIYLLIDKSLVGQYCHLACLLPLVSSDMSSLGIDVVENHSSA